MGKRKAVIVDMVKNTLCGGTDMEGEWNTTCDIDFILEKPCTFNVFEDEFVIDRIKMGSTWGDTIYLAFANADKEFHDFKVSKKFIHPIYLKAKEEEESGVLKGWLFSDALYDMLIEKEGQNHSIW